MRTTYVEWSGTGTEKDYSYDVEHSGEGVDVYIIDT